MLLKVGLLMSVLCSEFSNDSRLAQSKIQGHCHGPSGSMIVRVSAFLSIRASLTQLQPQRPPLYALLRPP